MKHPQADIIQRLDRFIAAHGIDIVKYNVKGRHWWKGRKAIITRRYENVCKEVIPVEATVCILYPMQYIRFKEVIHCGAFFVRDLDTGVSVGGISYRDLVLTGQRVKVAESWLFYD